MATNTVGKAASRPTAIYNPHLLAKDELIATFAARQPLLDLLSDDLRRGAIQHYVLVGQRGAGKTTMLLRLAYAIEDDPVLGKDAVALRFPEEQYNVHRVSDFWLNCVDALIDALERKGDKTAVRRLEAEVAGISEHEPEELARARRALALLTSWAAKAKRNLILLIDNFDLILERLREWHWALRDTLSEDNRLILLGGSSSYMFDFVSYHAAFYEFFRIHELHALDEPEARALLLHLASATDADRVKAALAQPGRFEALHLFSGGMPRTMVLLLRLLAAGTTTSPAEDLERLLDEVTPYYKARFEELPAQGQVVFDALALHYHPMLAAECARKTGLDVTTISSQLSRLARQGLVSKLDSADSSRLSFMIAERLFAVWYAIRTSRHLRRRLLGLVDAVRAFYAQEAVARWGRESFGDAGRELAPDVGLAGPLTLTPSIVREDWPETTARLRVIIEALSDASLPWFAFGDRWQVVANSSFATQAAEMLAASQWAERLAPLCAALNAAGEGRRGELVYLAPELRKPTEEILASWFAEEDGEKAVAYAPARGKASRAAEGRPTWGKRANDAAKKPAPAQKRRGRPKGSRTK